MRVIQNKKDMISYYQLNKNGKKKQGRHKNQVKVVKMRKLEKNLIKNWYYMHFDQKNYTKSYKMKLIKNKEDMIIYYQLKKNGKKSRGRPKIRSKLSKMRKIEKIW